jgi:hypothetical protein
MHAHVAWRQSHTCAAAGVLPLGISQLVGSISVAGLAGGHAHLQARACAAELLGPSCQGGTLEARIQVITCGGTMACLSVLAHCNLINVQ